MESVSGSESEDQEATEMRSQKVRVKIEQLRLCDCRCAGVTDLVLAESNRREYRVDLE